VPCYTRRVWHAVSPHPDLVAASVYGSVYPAVWNLQLAARARGLGSCFTAAHLRFESEAAALLALLDNIRQAGLVALAYTEGRFRSARRPLVADLAHRDRWSPAP